MSDSVGVTPALHRSLAVALFNRTWDLLDRPERSPADDLEMVHTAHASRYHWGVVGDSANLGIGEWQVSRVYAVLGRGEAALYHAERALEFTPNAEETPFLTGYAYEAIARAHAVLGSGALRDEALAKAEAAAARVADTADRDALLADLATCRGS